MCIVESLKDVFCFFIRKMMYIVELIGWRSCIHSRVYLTMMWTKSVTYL